jgi:hypothetical protein
MGNDLRTELDDTMMVLDICEQFLSQMFSEAMELCHTMLRHGVASVVSGFYFLFSLNIPQPFSFQVHVSEKRHVRSLF